MTCRFYLAALATILVLTSFREPSTALVPWNPIRKLVYEDFKQEIPLTSRHSAVSSVSIDVSYRTKGAVLYYDIKCHFDQTTSWMKIKNPWILNHEQRHFDIAELHARKIRAFFNSCTNRTISKADIDNAINALYISNSEMQRLYDKETNHSIDEPGQKKWDDFVSSQLDSLDTYLQEEGNIICKIKR